MNRYLVDGVEVSEESAIAGGIYHCQVCSEGGSHVIYEYGVVGGKKHGVEQGYYPNGVLFYKADYKEGERQSIEIYNEKGEVSGS